jgi:hypothetical protein
MKTAVEWLLDEMYKGELSMKDILIKAKEMEEKQIMDAWDNGCEYISENAEQYYNETFKSE